MSFLCCIENLLTVVWRPMTKVLSNLKWICTCVEISIISHLLQHLKKFEKLLEKFYMFAIYVA